ncbi:peptidoglycan DD-metalloendopeptidase family protein [Halomonas halodenitrificans]|uniref:peptidoglycan DD-metalloendopeptidase family protein n=1 Tax=Halomonas halodenitrificans TaxID=28252 RepID=UPI00047FEDFA|nr:peptidoglycan DD-metalloendopeptidase family protein [Halomonas halodenitrificans]
MRNVLMISGLALVLSGCVSQQDAPGQVPVRDLSASRANTTPSHYTVEQGDTLYGIAWRHSMDYRDLARLNRIGPPYEIQPGQRLVLDSGTSGEQSAARPPASDMGGNKGNDTGGNNGSAVAVATPLGGAQEDAADGDMEWLLPNGETETVSRNDRAPAAADEGASQSDEGASQSQASAGEEESEPGPVYSSDSDDADNSQDERSSAQKTTDESPDTQDVAETATREEPAAEKTSESTSEGAAKPDAGTAVAGGDQAPDRSSRTYSPVAEVPWQWPVSGDVVGQFGDGGTITAGIDIAGQKGQPVKAAGPGIVVYAGSGVRGYGKLILLKHNDQFLSAYAHNDTLKVSENDVVEAGEVIATMGDSDAEDTRLHFEVRKDGQPQDPLGYLP